MSALMHTRLPAASFRRRAALFAAVAIAAAGTGCQSEKVTWHPYPSMTFAEVSLPRGAVVRVVSSKDPSAKEFAGMLRKALENAGDVSVTAGADTPTHLVYVQGCADFRADTPEEAEFTGRVSVETKEGDSGSFQRIVRSGGSTCTSARELSLSVYDAKTLSPVAFLSLPMWDGRETSGRKDGDGKAEADMQNLFAGLAARRIEELFSTQNRSIRVPVPVEADPRLKVRFTQISAAVGAGDDEALKRQLSLLDDLADDPSVLPGTLEEFAAASAADGWAPPEGSSREQILGNYYLFALRREIGCTNPEEMEEIHSEMLRILELSEGPSLRMACPVALGRLETKLAALRR